MVIGIVGSRRRDTAADLEAVRSALASIHTPGDTIVSGGCPKGGDRFAEVLATAWDIPIKIYPAEWNKYGRGAGFYRNGFIARDADVLIACVAPDRRGGTEDTIAKYLALGKTRLILC